MKQANSLGLHPALNVLISAAILLGITIVIVGIVVLLNKILGILVGLLAGLVWFVATPKLLGNLIASFVNAAHIYKPAMKLVGNGELNPSYIGRNVICKGLAVVDEHNKRLYVNGVLYSFADVKSLASEENYVEIVFKQGAVPVHKIWFDSQRDSDVFYHRLGNNLGFSVALSK